MDRNTSSTAFSVRPLDMKSLEADDPAAAVVPESDPAAAVGPDPNPAAPVVPATDLETFLLSEELGVIMVNVFVLGLI